jgi:hypothetical protein
MYDEDVIPVVNVDADGTSLHPVIGERLRPERIDLKMRSHYVIGGGHSRLLQLRLTYAESYQSCD